MRWLLKPKNCGANGYIFEIRAQTRRFSNKCSSAVHFFGLSRCDSASCAENSEAEAADGLLVHPEVVADLMTNRGPDLFAQECSVMAEIADDGVPEDRDLVRRDGKQELTATVLRMDTSVQAVQVLPGTVV